ncbi:hypothetical protein NQ176_g7264 [Zarea fungicola]|uniref:Uncharacterized protein n=1 Tax=Zarea fungicola TaxID=93591 RepID=A0ACC1MZ20_9HYPO|nr:hypothetical protein NQ176_g7264 [Lecanicillium fungicola]
MAQSPLAHNAANSAASNAESILGNAYATSRATEGETHHRYFQQWTVGKSGRGYPIVDNKYFDGETGQVVNLGPDDQWSAAGPPALAVYWQNLGSATSEKGAFCAAMKSSTLSMTEYVTQVVGFLKDCKCELHSLTATTYSINIVFYAELSREDMWFLWKKYGL